MSADTLEEYDIVYDNPIDNCIFSEESMLIAISYWVSTHNVSPLLIQTDINFMTMLIYKYFNTRLCISNRAQHISYFHFTVQTFYSSLTRPNEQQCIDQSLLNSVEMSIHHIISWYKLPELLSYKLVAYGSMLHRVAIPTSDYDIGLVCESFTEKNEWFRTDFLCQLQQYIHSYLYAVFQCQIKGLKYPTLEITHRTVPFSIDISVDNGTIVARKAIINEWLCNLEKTNAIRPMITLIKTWSHQRNINSNWRKYVSSFAYVLMCICVHTLYRDCTDLEMVTAFFWYFGYIFDPTQDKIIIKRFPEAYVGKKTESDNVITIIDPVTDNNVSIACEWGKWLEIKTEMRMAYIVCVWWVGQTVQSSESLIAILTNEVELRICEWMNSGQIRNILSDKCYGLYHRHRHDTNAKEKVYTNFINAKLYTIAKDDSENKSLVISSANNSVASDECKYEYKFDSEARKVHFFWQIAVVSVLLFLTSSMF